MSKNEMSPTNQNNNDWFFIQSFATGEVVSASGNIAAGTQSASKSQVILRPSQHTAEELWRWDGEYLRNKQTDLVLDIRDGRLRLIEDTDICLYEPKPHDQAHSQLWGVRDAMSDPFNRELPGSVIYSKSNEDWVLDIKTIPDASYRKLILFPDQSIDNDNQRWSFVPVSNADALDAITNPVPSIGKLTPTSSSPIDNDMSIDSFPKGLTPAKRGSQSSATMYTLEAFRESHQMVYLERKPHLSDKTIAMAAAYQAWQNWRQEEICIDAAQDDRLHRADQTRLKLQSKARDEAASIFDACDQLSNHKDTALTLTSRLVTQLNEQFPCTP